MARATSRFSNVCLMVRGYQWQLVRKIVTDITLVPLALGGDSARLAGYPSLPMGE
jgi:hypothetical protein